MVLNVILVNSSRLFSYSAVRIFLALIFLLAALADLSAQRADTQSPQDTLLLELGKPISREIAPDDIHKYPLHLETGQFVHVVVNAGEGIFVALFDSQGKAIESPQYSTKPEVDSRRGIMFLASDTRDYFIYVFRFADKGKQLADGRYEVKIEALRTATRQDRVDTSLRAAYREYVAGTSHSKGDKKRQIQALDEFKDALALYRSVSEQERKSSNFLPVVEEETLLYEIGKVYFDLFKYQESSEYFRQSLNLCSRKGKDCAFNEDILVQSIGDSLINLGAPQKALDFYTEYLKKRETPFVLILQGDAFGYTGELQKQIDTYQRALEISDEKDLNKALALERIGELYVSIGEHQKALNYYLQALENWKKVKDNRDEEAEHYLASMLTKIGSLYEQLREEQRAIENLKGAIEIYHREQEDEEEAKLLSQLGYIYVDFGEKQKAIDIFTQLLERRRKDDEGIKEQWALFYLGNCYERFNEKQRALDFYKQAMKLSLEDEDKQWLV